jgi:hypothetical protein
LIVEINGKHSPTVNHKWRKKDLSKLLLCVKIGATELIEYPQSEYLLSGKDADALSIVVTGITNPSLAIIAPEKLA